MKVHKKEHVSPFDIDSTLVHDHKGESNYIRVEDPLGGGHIKVVPNANNIRLLKEEHARGSHIIVWSRGGYQWAENVIKALKLEEYVSDIYTKPFVYFDDKDVSEWMNQRVWIDPKVRYKR